MNVCKWQRLYNKMFPWLCVMEYALDLDEMEANITSLKWYPIRMKEICIWLNEYVCIMPFIIRSIHNLNHFIQINNCQMTGTTNNDKLNSSIYNVYIALRNKTIASYTNKAAITLHKCMCLIVYPHESECTIKNIMQFNKSVLHLTSHSHEGIS